MLEGNPLPAALFLLCSNTIRLGAASSKHPFHLSNFSKASIIRGVSGSFATAVPLPTEATLDMVDRDRRDASKVGVGFLMLNFSGMMLFVTRTMQVRQTDQTTKSASCSAYREARLGHGATSHGKTDTSPHPCLSPNINPLSCRIIFLFRMLYSTQLLLRLILAGFQQSKGSLAS